MIERYLNRRLWYIGLAIIIPTGLFILLFFVVPQGVREEAASQVKDLAGQTSEAEQAGRQLAGGKCQGSGPVKLTHSPMNPEDFAFIIPYGLMVDSHVTPIDHQYFSPAVFDSKPDTYPVYAMADGTITEISHRGQVVGGGGRPSNDYRFVFSHTCTFLTYYDLVTSLAPDIKTEFDKNAKKNGSHSHARLDIPVKAGQLVGYIGGQTLDFAVWDTEKPLTGFISPKLYEVEGWKIYTADPLDYYADELKQLALSKYLRTTPPASGRIDYDQDGKLVGNWFQEGTGGYEGDRQQPDGKYWRGHLAFAPGHLDPSQFIASFGSFKEPGDGEQLLIKPGQMTPEEVTVGSGLTKYELSEYSYLKQDGEHWNRTSHTVDPRVVATTGRGIAGCVLVQLVEDRKLKAEPFPGRSCGGIAGFTAAANTFVR